MKRLSVLLTIMLLLATGCTGGKHELAITVDLQCKDGETCEWGDLETGCRGLGGYSDIHNGMKVTVRDSDGDILGTSSMKDTTGTCVFRATVEVGDADVYEITAGNRSPHVVSKSELESLNWDIRLTLGSYD